MNGRPREDQHVTDHYVRIGETQALCDCCRWASFVKSPGGQEQQLMEDGARHLAIEGWDHEVLREGMVGPVVALITTTRLP